MVTYPLTASILRHYPVLSKTEAVENFPGFAQHHSCLAGHGDELEALIDSPFSPSGVEGVDA